MSVEGRRTIFNIDICEIIDQASNMKNRISKSLEKELLQGIDPELLAEIDYLIALAQAAFQLEQTMAKARGLDLEQN
jgi:hypothetical protein